MLEPAESRTRHRCAACPIDDRWRRHGDPSFAYVRAGSPVPVEPLNPGSLGVRIQEGRGVKGVAGRRGEGAMSKGEIVELILLMKKFDIDYARDVLARENARQPWLRLMSAVREAMRAAQHDSGEEK